jgi:hypothetical protein
LSYIEIKLLLRQLEASQPREIFPKCRGISLSRDMNFSQGGFHSKRDLVRGFVTGIGYYEIIIVILGR